MLFAVKIDLFCANVAPKTIFIIPFTESLFFIKKLHVFFVDLALAQVALNERIVIA